jgi:hypothetical protein
MTAGGVVWLALGSVWLLWLVVTRFVRGLPGIESVLHVVLRSWLGRVVAIAAWAEAGWHLFGQRP